MKSQRKETERMVRDIETDRYQSHSSTRGTCPWLRNSLSALQLFSVAVPATEAARPTQHSRNHGYLFPADLGARVLMLMSEDVGVHRRLGVVIEARTSPTYTPWAGLLV